MLDILVALVEEMFGTKKKQAQPRRNVRRGGAASTASQTQTPWQTQSQRSQAPVEPDEHEEQQGFDDLVRQFFGIPEDEPFEVVESEPEPPPPPPPPPKASYVARQAVVEPRKLISVPDEPPQTITGTLGAKYENMGFGNPAEQKKADEGPTGRELAERLGKDPAAARTAFIYSEILGPPKADRLYDN